MRPSLSPHSGQFSTEPHSALSKVFRQLWHENSMGVRATGPSLVAERVRYTRPLGGRQQIWRSGRSGAILGRRRRVPGSGLRADAETLLQHVVDRGVALGRVVAELLQHFRRRAVTTL